MKILLVEDDPSTRELLAFHLTAARYTVEQATDGTIALELALLWSYDLIILDLNIPRLDGISLCRQLRQQSIATPILMLTATTGDAAIVTGLDAGADDYVTKPFEVQGVLARVRALLRRGVTATAMPSLTWGNVCLNPALAQVTYGDQIIPLTPKEYSLLELFLRHPQRVFSRSTILDHLWTIDDSPTEGAVTNLVKDLRNRLKRSGVSENVIQTVYGLGYRLRELSAASATESSHETSAEEAGDGHLPGSAVATLPSGEPASPTLDNIAARFRTSLQERIAVLESAVQQLQAGSALSPQERAQVCDEAHRLAGGLGTFGYEDGSRQAHQMEQLLALGQPLESAQMTQLSHAMEALKQCLEPQSDLTVLEDVAPKSSGRVVAIDLEPAIASRLQQVAPQRGWQVEFLASRGETPVVLPGEVDGVVLALNQAVPLAEKLAPLRNIRAHNPQLPVLVISPEDSLEERVQVARLQGNRYLVTPLMAHQIVDALEQIVPRVQPPEAQVLVVDNDPVTRAMISELLTPWGLQVTELGEPQQFLQVLRQVQPDLLLLALDMPTFSGVELCQVVRQDPQFGNLPILMITAHPDAVTVRQVFEVGGDDLIGNPIVGPELVTRVLSRIERSRLRQQLDQLRQQQSMAWSQPGKMDLLTQVANISHFQAFLQQQWERHRQDQAPISLILCKIDDFGAYQNLYGQQAGDLVLQRMARTLYYTVNPNIDLVARSGDTEFGIVLPNTNLDGALRVVTRLQQAVEHLQIPHGASRCCPHITLSLGIGGAIPNASLSHTHMLTIADQALKDAEGRGGNTFCLYPM